MLNKQVNKAALRIRDKLLKFMVINKRRKKKTRGKFVINFIHNHIFEYLATSLKKLENCVYFECFVFICVYLS